MKHIIQYSVLGYSPSIISGENINLGVLICNSDNNRIEFHYTRQWDRVKKFDDELDIQGLKSALEDIKNDVETPVFSINRQFSIDAYTRDFVSELHFSKPLQIETDNIDNQILELRKIYLRFDFDKKDRITQDNEFKFVKSLFTGYGMAFKQNERVFGEFGVPISYDLIYNHYGIRYIRFDNKDISKMINSIKAYAWDSKHDHTITPIFIYSPENTNARNKTYMDMSLRILNDVTENVYSTDDAQIADILLEFRDEKCEGSLLSNVR